MVHPIFGRYNPFIDEGVHMMLSLTISLIGYISGIGLVPALFCFLAGYLIDLDHLLNPPIARLLGLHSYERSFAFSEHGYTIKILHGFDMAVLIGALFYFISSNLMFALVLAVNLSVHEVWDFLVYPFSWKELFLITRIKARFHPGERKLEKGLFFDLKTEHY